MYFLPFSNNEVVKQRAIQSALAAVILAISLFAIPSTTTSASPNQSSRYFPNTQRTVRGEFLQFYDTHGGGKIFGYPITEEVIENGRRVQYFERQRFEYYPQAVNKVQLGRLGYEVARGRASLTPVAPFQPTANRIYITETKHSLSGAFLQYWRENGAVRIFGYPISEPHADNGRIVQYFERARMEYIPLKASPGYKIELGQLGREYMQARSGGATTTQAAIAPAKANYTAQAPAAPQVQQAFSTGEWDLAHAELLKYINEGRVAAGLPAVALDRQVASLAQARSADMATRNYFSHTTPEGSDFLAMLKGEKIPFKLAGEVLNKNNYGTDKTARAAYDNLMKSPAHRAIIMDPRYNLVGAGVEKSEQDYYYFTVIFVQR